MRMHIKFVVCLLLLVGCSSAALEDFEHRVFEAELCKINTQKAFSNAQECTSSECRSFVKMRCQAMDDAVEQARDRAERAGATMDSLAKAVSRSRVKAHENL